MSAEAAQAEMAAESGRLRRDTLANYAGLILPGACEILLVPILLHGLGKAQYGIWLVLVAIVAIGASLEIGLASIVTREVAGDEDRSHCNEFLGAALFAFILLVLAGALGIAASSSAANLLAGVLPRSAPHIGVVFAAVGAGFLFDRIRGFVSAILRGARRFDLLNFLTVGSSLLWALGVIVLLSLGFELPALGIWWAVSSASMMAAAWAVFTRVRPLQLPNFRLRALRGYMSFGLASQLMTAISMLNWELPALLIGVILGSGQIVAYHIARQFPYVIYGIGWCAATVLFPESAGYGCSDDHVKAEGALRFATRWIVLTTLPLALILYAVAPNLLRVWIGHPDLDTLVLFRILCIATFIDVLAAGALNTLWGAGRAAVIAKVGAVQTLISSCTCAILLPLVGVSGVGWALLLPIPICTSVFLALASSGSMMRARSLVAGAFRGLVLPAIACATTALALERAVGGASVTSLMGISTVSALVYSALVAAQPGNESERSLLVPIYGWCASAIRR